ncbi:YcjF family protein [Allofustis seminis]|uniref:YcjF family protein n=1 Tax=Allofustis seminis TaxID=166939 RepID=UPI00036033C0|nr:GTPase [Allofustis seminis]
MVILDHERAARHLLEQANDEISKMKPLHILLIGKSGVGKSTLINCLFRENLATTGIGKPVTKHLIRIEKENVPIVLYDTQGLELDEMIQDKVKNEVFDAIAAQRGTDDDIDVAYYCIQSMSNRIESIEIEWTEQLAKKMPVLLILTQAIGTQAEAFITYLNSLNLPVSGIHPVLAKDFPVDDNYTIHSFGLMELIDKTWQVIPEDTKKSFNNAQQVDLDRKVKAAEKWSRKYIAMTFGVGFTPIPFSDASVLVPMQITLLAHITAIFGVPIEYSTVVSIIAAVGGTGSATYLGKSIVSNAFKLIPGVGTVVGGFISGVTAAIITSALAKSYISVLKLIAESNRSGNGLTPKTIVKLVQIEFEKRLKAEATTLKKESHTLNMTNNRPNKKTIRETLRHIFKRNKN